MGKLNVRLKANCVILIFLVGNINTYIHIYMYIFFWSACLPLYAAECSLVANPWSSLSRALVASIFVHPPQAISLRNQGFSSFATPSIRSGRTTSIPSTLAARDREAPSSAPATSPMCASVR